METLGYLSATVMGLVLGLIGGGGSILAVPILTYLFLIPGATATYYSLFIVGFSAAVAVIPYSKRGLVKFRTALLFFVPSIIGVTLSRRLILPSLPQSLSISNFIITKDMIILFSFGIVMMVAALSMIRKRPNTQSSTGGMSPIKVSANGFGVGVLTGFVGAGGGFLIVPALVNGLGLSMENAVGTSLLIIALNSLLGFTSDLVSGMTVQWDFIIRFSLVALIGIGLGSYFNKKISPQKLKPAFGWFVLVVGLLMVIKQLF